MIRRIRKWLLVPTAVTVFLVLGSQATVSTLLDLTILAAGTYLLFRVLRLVQRPVALGLIGAGVMLDKHSRETFRATWRENMREGMDK